MFGKTATEVMWITEASEGEYYQTGAESHGSVYTSRLDISGDGDGHVLTMSFSAKAQSFLMKVFAPLMGLLLKGMMRKAIGKDLEDIKAAVESPKAAEAPAE